MPLPAPSDEQHSPMAEADVAFEIAPGPVEPPLGKVRAHVDDVKRGRRFSLVAEPSGWAMHFVDTATVRMTYDRSQALVIHAPTVSIELLSVLLGGPTLVAACLMQGRSMLHASAVSGARGVVAIVGAPGSGKSSLARLLSNHGYRLFSDDALRIDLDGPRVIAHRGTTTSRLRSRGHELLGAGSPGLLSTTADGRQALMSQSDVGPVGEVVVIALPRLSPLLEVPATVAMPRMAAALELSAASPMDGVFDAAMRRRQFEAACEIVERVPVVELFVPWRPGSLPDHLGADLVGLLDDVVLTDGPARG